MAKTTTQFVCQSCGALTGKWQGRCDSCGDWNTIVEEISSANPPVAGGGRMKKGRAAPLTSLYTNEKEPDRLITGVRELDRAIGGGLVPGSATLVGGDPGIGKSTLLLQAAGKMAAKGHTVLYFSGEEAAAQVKMRARRLGMADVPMKFGTETNAENILATLDTEKDADLVILDSIQTLYTDSVESAPGTVTQVRTTAQALIRAAKQQGFALMIVGHVTKDGQIAGPRVLEHMVDTVLYFEGDRGHQFRILRAVKNRFGPADEIGVFEMTGGGLEGVENPSSLFLAAHTEHVPGSVVFAGLEGSRPVLVEIQALVAPTMHAQPRRAVVGWDSGRLAMVLAVLDSKLGLGFGGYDVYLNVAGGLRISEPAADLAVATALVSSLTGRPAPAQHVVFGEISLAGDIRPVAQSDIRLKEAKKLGFKGAIMARDTKTNTKGIALLALKKVTEMPDHLEEKKG